MFQGFRIVRTEQAVEEAIAQYEIDNPNEQAQLAAQRVREIS